MSLDDYFREKLLKLNRVLTRPEEYDGDIGYLRDLECAIDWTIKEAEMRYEQHSLLGYLGESEHFEQLRDLLQRGVEYVDRVVDHINSEDDDDDD